jgi:tetratricopeptide (TPR) repeat protein
MKMSKHLILYVAVVALLSIGLAAPAAADNTEARRHMARGAAAMEMAQSPADYRDAVAEFSQAVKLAPDWADAWFNLGVAQESAGDYRGAIDSFRTYLKKSPAADDRQTVETRIFKLEYKMEKVSKNHEKARRSAVSIDSLSGHWKHVNLWNTFDMAGGKPRRDGQQWLDLGGTASADVRVTGSSIEIKVRLAGTTRTYSGTISGNRIEGRMTDEGTQCGARSGVKFEGEVWPKDKVIMVIARGFCDGYGRQRNDNYRSSHLLLR